jgi:hypothetical protein
MAFKPRLFPIAVLIAFASLLLVSMGHFADDPGVGWHLETGNFILTNGKIPFNDPFLFFSSPREWVSDQWLSDCLIALIYKWGGFPLVYASGTALFVITFFALLFPTLKRTEGVAIPSIIGTFFAFEIAQVHFILRPVLIAFFFFAGLFRLLAPIYQTGERMVPYTIVAAQLRRFYFIIPCFFVLWANLHPSFTIGLIFIFLILLGFFLDQFFFADSWPRRDLLLRKKGFAKLLLFSSVATLINPYGWRLHQSIFDLGTSSFFMNYHQEWLTPDFSLTEGQFVEWFIFATILSFIVRSRARRVSMVDFALICFFTHAALDAVRFLPFFGIVMSPYLTRSFQIFSKLEGLPGFSFLASAYQKIEKREFQYSKPIVLSLCVVLLIGYTLITRKLPFNHEPIGPDSKKFPYDEMSQLRALVRNDGNVVIAASPYLGGFITWRGEGKLQALIDDRNTLLGEKIYQDFDKFLTGQGDWRQYFRSLGATHLMLKKDDAFATRLRTSNELKLVTEGPVVSIFSLN